MQAQVPQTLWIVRHGQSAGNVARDEAEAAGLPRIDIEFRDIDTPLSELGIEQSEALGEWFASRGADERPEVILCSPYVRAHETALAIHRRLGGGAAVRLRQDERLREKEFGILDRLTKYGIREFHPELAEQRAHVGKFYFRPPGGESWCDVILRLRSTYEMITREYGGQRVLVVAHQVIVNCMRYLVESMDEKRILEIDAMGDVPNCGVTWYRREGDELVLEKANFVSPLRRAGAAVTAEPDAQAAPKP